MNDWREGNDLPVFKELFLASPIAIYICGKTGYIIGFNEAAAQLWGRQPKVGEEKWSGALSIYNADGRLMPIEESPMFLVHQAGMEVVHNELVIERADGTHRNVLAFSKPLWATTGELSGSHHTLVDVTDYKQYEEKQVILTEIVQSSEDAIIGKDLGGIIKSWNAGAQRIFGYSEDEIVGKSIKMLIPSYLQEEEETILQEINQGRKVDHYETIRVTKSGREVPISLTISPMRNKQGQIIGASKIARDISDKIQREQTIQFHAKQLETLHTIGKVLSEKLDTRSTMQTVIESTTHLAAADVGLCFYRIADEEGRSKLSVAGAIPGEGRTRDFAIHLEDHVIQTLFSRAGAVRMEDVCQMPAVHTLFDIPRRDGANPIRHCLAIPIRSADKLLFGAMFFGYGQWDVFRAANEDMMRSIASLVGVTLDNARLFDEVNALNLKKNEFIALASHELKTPLTTTKGYLQILERAEIDQVGRRFLSKALKQLERINALIAELLDISKIEAGKLSFHFEHFDVNEMVLDVVETFHFSSQTHTILVNNTQGDYVVEADRQRMEQVLINLITNAIKYSPDANNVYVLLESSANEVTVQVKDEGMGLSAEEQVKIFNRFYQVGVTSKMAGLGLGLYLSKEIIERHGGRIGVNSKLGMGSTFYFSIPRRQFR